MNQSSPWLLLVLVLFPILWVGLLNLLARMSGWSRLATTYRYRGRFEGFRKRFVSGHLVGGAFFGLPCNYGSCLTLGSNAQGLYLAVLAPFRPGHPPLFIPWRDVTARLEQRWLFKLVTFSFQQVP